MQYPVSIKEIKIFIHFHYMYLFQKFIFLGSIPIQIQLDK